MMTDSRTDTIYVYINSEVKTGGPRALLQLASCLNAIGENVTLILKSEEAHRCYESWIKELFQNKSPKIIYETILQDIRNACIVIPETQMLQTIDSLDKSVNIVLYMLSVDNSDSLLSFDKYGLRMLFLTMKRLKKNFRTLQEDRTKVSRIKLVLTQSHYADNVIGKRFQIPYFFIGDKTDFSFQNNCARDSQRSEYRVPKICYNASKGKFFSFIARACNRSIDWKPIQNMDHDQVMELIKSCDYYCDFGSQPGKDRLPRESILCGTLPIILNRGAGQNYSDFNFLKNQKMSIFNIFNIQKFIKKITPQLAEELIRIQTERVLLEEEEFFVRVKAFRKLEL